MNQDSPAEDVAEAYAAGVRALLAPSGPATGPAAAERGGAAPGPASFADLAVSAQALEPLSAQLISQVSAELDATDTATRQTAANRLLAKALADLEVMAYLGQAAMDEIDGLTAPPSADGERSGGGTEIENVLDIVLGRFPPPSAGTMRGGPEASTTPTDAAAGRAQLITGADDALSLITDRATKAGQAAVTGILSIGVTELASAAAAVGTDLATAVGFGAAATQLVQRVSGFAAQAGNTVSALLGPSLAQTATQQVLTWVDEVRSGGKFAEILAKAYDTPATLAEVQRLAEAASEDPARFGVAIAAIDALDEAYAAQVALAEKILAKARFLNLIPAGALPQGRVLIGAIYLGLSGYIILCGADYADSPRLALLQRVPGVSDVVAARLAAA